MIQSSGVHKVFLQKRNGVESQPATTAAATEIGGGINCSICGDSLPGARELGVHILAAHCDVYQQAEHQEDSLVIEGSPGLSMEVEVDPLESTPQVKEEEPTAMGMMNLPRAPTANELKQKFMVFRVSDTSNRYICLVCDKVYTSRYNIRMHMNLHNGTNIHTCSFCGRKFAHKHVFESHVRTHTGERPFACEKCGRRFGDRSNCSSHMKRCFGVISEVPTPVGDEENESKSINIAPNVSITPIRKLKIENTEDGSNISEAGQDPLTISFAPQIISVQSMSVNNNNDDDFVNMGYDGDSEENEDSEEMMIEPDISLDYDDIEEVEEGQDEGVEGPGSLYTCSFCSCQYGDQASLLEHLHTHVDIPHSPVEAEVLQGYMTLYTTSRPKFMCLHCGKFFVNCESVTVHVKVHVDEKVYSCELCMKMFPHKHLYDSHMRSEHPQAFVGTDHECLFCHNMFPNAVSLNNHTRTCSSRPIEITPPHSANNNNANVQEKKKANRPPPKLIMLNNSSSLNTIVAGDHILIQRSEVEIPPVRRPINIAPKPTVSLLSEEAKKIFNSSAPSIKQSVPGDNPRAHKIVETSAGREYIPDTNSNNIINLDTIYPQPSTPETKRGFMLRPCGKYNLIRGGGGGEKWAK